MLKLGGRLSVLRGSVPMMAPRRNIGDTSMVQEGLIALQSSTGLSWASTFAVSTLFVRFVSVPLIRAQMVASNRFAGGMLDFRNFFDRFIRKFRAVKKNDFKALLYVLSNGFKGFRACSRLHAISFSKIFGLPLLNASGFLYFVFSIRQLIFSKVEGVDTGGHLWFKNLEEADSTYALPAISIALSYLNIELGKTAGVAAPLWVAKMRNFFQIFILMSSFWVVTFPAGVFTYWIPSSLMAMVQIVAMRNPAVLRMMKLPSRTPGGGINPPSATVFKKRP